MLVRDDPDLHVFMLRRNLNADWVGGAYVFPGGAVDADDRLSEVAARCPGRTDGEASSLLGLTEGGLAFWVAAVRETFEEAGVLLARPRGERGAVLDVATVAAAERLAVARGSLNRREKRFADLVADEDLVLDVESLHVFSHWVTPVGMPRRYDTWFFVAAAPDGHAYLHDDAETVASAWIRPGDAVERAEQGELEIIFPTRRNLEALARFERAADLVEYVRDASDVPPTTQPRIVADANGARLLLPGDTGYDDAIEPPDDAWATIADAVRAVGRGGDREGAA
jgi:8-oxo-dGTP pyrophosphatase MutT (NUDIX family)